MSAPKHLWSGDWRADSATAARERANRRTDPEPVEPPAPPPLPAPSLLARAVSNLRALWRTLAAALAELAAALRRLRFPSAPRRGAVIVLAALLLIAGAAFGLSALLGSNGSSVASAARNIPYLGVRMESVPVNRVLVAGVVPGSPAARAGLGPGDVITAVNNHAIGQPGDVIGALSPLHPGDSVSIQITRGGIPYTTRATLASEPSPSP